MDDNPYQSPQSVNEHGRGFPRIPTMLFHAAGLMMLGFSGTLLTASYATDALALRALGVGIALGALAGLCFLFPVVRWLRGRSESNRSSGPVEAERRFIVTRGHRRA